MTVNHYTKMSIETKEIYSETPNKALNETDFISFGVDQLHITVNSAVDHGVNEETNKWSYYENLKLWDLRMTDYIDQLEGQNKQFGILTAMNFHCIKDWAKKSGDIYIDYSEINDFGQIYDILALAYIIFGSKNLVNTDHDNKTVHYNQRVTKGEGSGVKIEYDENDQLIYNNS